MTNNIELNNIISKFWSFTWNKLIKINNNITSGNKYIFKSKRMDKLLQVTNNSKEKY